MVGEAGIEPTTPGLEGRCSIRLSYSPTIFIVAAKWPDSGGAAAGKRISGDSLKIADNRGLGPMHVVGRTADRKAQWPPWRDSTKAMWGLEWMRARVSGVRRMKGSSCSAEDERGNRDAVDDAGAGGAVVVVVGIALKPQ